MPDQNTNPGIGYGRKKKWYKDGRPSTDEMNVNLNLGSNVRGHIAFGGDIPPSDPPRNHHHVSGDDSSRRRDKSKRNLIVILLATGLIATALWAIWNMKDVCLRCGTKQVPASTTTPPPSDQGQYQSGPDTSAQYQPAVTVPDPESQSKPSGQPGLANAIDMSDQQILAVYDMVNRHAGVVGNLPTWTGYTTAEILTGLALHESRGNPWAVGTKGEKGLLQVRANRVEFLNENYGYDHTLDNYYGDSPEAIKRNLLQLGEAGLHSVPRKIRGSLHAWIKSNQARPKDSQPNEYSESVMRWIDAVKDARQKRERANKLALAPPTRPKAARINVRSTPVSMKTRYIHPLPGRREDGRGVELRKGRDIHKGFDYPAPYNTPIYASNRGTVVRSGWWGDYGNCVAINDGQHVCLYAHMSKRPIVKMNQRVSKGQQIGLVGATGNATGNHLHIECYTIAEWNNKMNGRKDTPITEPLWQ